MTTIVRAAFTHHAAHRLLRTRESKRYRGTVDVEIREATGARIPLALTVAGKGPGGGVLELRSDGERLYRPLLSPQGAPMTAEAFKRLLIDPSMMRDDAPYWPDFPFPRASSTSREMGLGRLWDNPLSHPTLDESFNLGALVHNDAAEVADRTVRRAAELRNIDGMMHVPCGEPVWRLDCETGEVDVMVSTDASYLQPHLSSEFFRLDHADRIPEALAKVGVGITWRTLPDHVGIVDGSALRFDPAPVAVAKLYGSTLHLINRLGTSRGPDFEAARQEIMRHDLAVYEGLPGAGTPGLQAFVDLVAAGSLDTPEGDRLRAIDGHVLRLTAAVLETYVVPGLEPEAAPAPRM